MRDEKVTVVLPARNEADRLAESVRRLDHFCRGNLHDRDWHILVAVNGSDDGTEHIAELMSRRLGNVSTLVLQSPGRGGALRRAATLAASGGDTGILVYMDVDLSTDLRALPALLEAVSAGADIAVGSRRHKRSQVTRSPARTALTAGYNTMLRLFLRVRTFSDAQCGFKAFRLPALASLLPHVHDNGWFFDTEVLFLAERAGMQIAEIPIHWVEARRSSVDIPSTILENLAGMARLRLSRSSMVAITGKQAR